MVLLSLCRSCMVEVASWELQNFDNDAVEMFTYCTNVEVSKDDKLPKQFCNDCIIKIESSYIFIKKAQEVNVTLKNLVSRKETNVIVKSNNLENALKYNESNSLQSDLDFSSDDQMDERDDDNQSLEIKMDVDNYSSKLNSPQNAEIEKTSKNKEYDLPETKLNSYIDDFDTYSDGISTDDPHNVQKAKVKKKYSNCTRNNKYKEKQTKVSESVISGRKSHNITTRAHKSHKFETSEKGKDESNDDEKLFECDICKISYKFKSGFLKHLNSKHSEAPKENEDRPKEKGDNTKPDLKCDICDQTYKSATWLSRHYRKMHSNAGKQYFCPHCPKFFSSPQYYYYHVQTHDEYKKFACDECGARFKRGKQLAAHARTHTHARPHVCTTCGKAFKLKATLMSHMKLHSDERPHLCSTCGFSSKCAFTLKSHMLAHMGEKPLSCKECSFRTLYAASMRLHKLRHRGERRHACDQCDKRFYEKGSLGKHMRQVHTGERPFQCYLCASAFVDAWKCKTHIMRTHGIPLEEIPQIRKHRIPKEPISPPV